MILCIAKRITEVNSNNYCVPDRDYKQTKDKRKEQADKMNYFDCHVDTLTEIVKPGDTLWHIAKKYKTSVEKILKTNEDILDPDKINVGQKIFVIR